jgi:hypothetical protein
VGDSRLLVLFVLDVLWKDDDRWSIVRLRHSDASVDQMPPENRRVIKLCIVQPRNQMGGAWPAGRQADPNFTGELGVGYGHEGRHFFVPDLNEVNLVSPLQGTDHAVDAITWISVDPANTPGVQTLNDKIADFHGEAPGSQRADGGPGR